MKSSFVPHSQFLAGLQVGKLFCCRCIPRLDVMQAFRPFLNNLAAMAVMAIPSCSVV